MPATILERDEFVEQAFFFRTLRERLLDGAAAQDILNRAHEELLSTTKLPYAVQFIAGELKHSGLMANGFSKLPHYFTPFQAYVVRQAEDERSRLTIPIALIILEREANYKANALTVQGLFVYQFETISRNRLGYDEGLISVAGDPFYSQEWKDYIDIVRLKVGTIDFCDMVYLRSELYVMDQKRNNSTFEPSVKPLYGEKEGKIAKASRGRDPLYLFAALQRQLGYPEVPRLRAKDDITTKLEVILQRLSQIEQRMKLAEGELRGSIDWAEFGKPDMFRDLKDE